MLTLFHWLATTHLSIALANSQWAFAVIEVFHLLSLAISGGAILYFDIRLLGWGFASQSEKGVARSLFPLAIIGITAMSISGVLMVASGPVRYYYNPAFRLKMYLFAAALIFHFAVQWTVSRRSDDRKIAVPDRIAAVISLLLWLSIGVAGRAIGFV
jgi:hypothetical protein